MKLAMRVRTEGWMPGTYRARAQLRKAQKAGFMGMADHWHGKPRAMRFSMAAYLILGLTRRSGRKMKVNPLPFVWSSETKQRSQNVHVTATYKGAKLWYSLQALNYKPRGWDHTMRDEWETIAPNEPDALAEVGGRRIMQRLSSMGISGGARVERITW